jgi:DNA topoisomerase-1
MISAGLGRYGPFVLHDGNYANLETIEDVFSIGINRAVSVIADKGRRAEADAAERQPRSKTWASIRMAAATSPCATANTVPYVNFGKVNATLPKGKDPQTVTVEDAVTLIAEKEAKGGGAKKPARAKAAPAAKKKAPAKKAAAKKKE